jgi:RNA polymerase sigma factor (sigma-70 family)
MDIIEYTPEFESNLVGRARNGDQACLAMLLDPLQPQLFAYIYGMVTHRQDANKLMRNVLENVSTGLPTFRCETSFRVWSFSIATRMCLDHLRSKRRWRLEAQIHAELEADSRPDVSQRFFKLMTLPGSRFEVAEHVAFCFFAVARTLEPEHQSALLLTEILQFQSAEGAKVLGVSESEFRYRLAAAREVIALSFEGLCQLLDKSGACCQCSSLWTSTPPEYRGQELYQISLPPGAVTSAEALLDARLEIVRVADLQGGNSHLFHDSLYQFLTEQEEGKRSESAATA